MGEDPIESALLLLLLFSKLNRIFEGLKMLEKSGNFCTRPRSGENLRLIWVSKWVWQNGSIAPPIHFNGVHLELRFTYKYKSWYTHVT